jgi:uncharacterized protein with PIN domain
MITNEQKLAEDAWIEAEYPRLFEGFPPCPACGHLHVSHWNGAIRDVKWHDFHGTSLNQNDGYDGDSEEIVCPKCGKTYIATLHVERITSITAELKDKS